MELLLLLFLTVVFILLVGFRKKSASSADAAKTESDIPKTESLLLKHKELFDHLFPNPLTQEQRLCIVDDSHRTLVIASAGSGKTTTLIGKYAFLLAEGLAAPEEILVVAFNSSIAEEVKERIEKLVSGRVNAEVYTFHSFGLKLLNEAEGRKKLDHLAESSSDGLLTAANVLKIIDKAKDGYPEIENWISEFRITCPYHQTEEFALSEKEYNERVATYPYKREAFRHGRGSEPLRIPSLNAKYWVRSQQELAIINGLILKGVNVEYEKPYPGEAVTPDFYYPEIDLWHEHFAIRRDGSSPFGEEYVSQHLRKKEFYREQGKDLLSTYSYEYYEGGIFEKIFRKLDEKGISYDPPPKEDINRWLGELYTDDTYNLIATCVKLAKASDLSAADLSVRLDSLNDKLRSRLFKRFFLPVFETYQRILGENGTIDFEDMILRPTGHLKGGGGEDLRSDRYKYVLVDEFSRYIRIQEEIPR